MLQTTSGSWDIAAMVLMLGLSLNGCGGGPGSTPRNSNPSNQPTQVTAYGITIGPESSPRDVAHLALEAINTGDVATLDQLLGITTIQADLEAITRGKRSFEKVKANAQRIALAAIKSEIGALDAEPRDLGDVQESGNKAIVFINGKLSGAEAKRRLFLVKEPAGWRLVPSHHD